MKVRGHQNITMAEVRMAMMMAERDMPMPDHMFDAYLSAMHLAAPTKWIANLPADKTVDKLLAGEYKEGRDAAIEHIRRKDFYIATCGYLWYDELANDTREVRDSNTYRVSVFPDHVTVLCFGLESVDSCLEGTYHSVDVLPDWVKERLAVLNMIPPSPPTYEVEGVGRRISATVYWVFAPTNASTSA